MCATGSASVVHWHETLAEPVAHKPINVEQHENHSVSLHHADRDFWRDYGADGTSGHAAVAAGVAGVA